MVSLFDMLLQLPTWGHLSTGVPTLDQMLQLQNDGLFDFQCVPANPGMPAMICNLMISHLQEGNKVVVVETFNPFQWDLLRQHPHYDTKYESQIRIYSMESMAEIFWFFTFGPASSLKAEVYGSVLLFITNFHEVVQLYRLHISASYEEALLKHQIDKNRVLLANFDRAKEEGVELIQLPQLPVQSGLLRQNPYIVAQNHIDELFKEMAEFTYRNSAVVVLLGHLEPKFRPYKRSMASPNSSFTSQSTMMSQVSSQDNNRLVLEPVIFSKSGSFGDANLNESKITARLIFYNDWYHKTQLFLSKSRRIQPQDQFLILAVKVTSLHGVSNINEPVYFDISSTHQDKSNLTNTWLVDLQTPEFGNLSALIQDSLNSTQPRMSTQIARQLAISSSPPPNALVHEEEEVQEYNEEEEEEDQEEDQKQDDEKEEKRLQEKEEYIHENGVEEDDSGVEDAYLYIEDSDVELTGTLLEDLQ